MQGEFQPKWTGKDKGNNAYQNEWLAGYEEAIRINYHSSKIETRNIFAPLFQNRLSSQTIWIGDFEKQNNSRSSAWHIFAIEFSYNSISLE